MSHLEIKEDTLCFSFTEHIFLILCSCNFLAYHVQVNCEKKYSHISYSTYKACIFRKRKYEDGTEYTQSIKCRKFVYHMSGQSLFNS